MSAALQTGGDILRQATAVGCPPGPLGEALLARGILTPEQLAESLDLGRRWRMRLGEVVVAKGFARELDVARVLADHLGLPFADLRAEPPDQSLLTGLNIARIRALRALPWRREADGTIRFATDDPAAAEANLRRTDPEGGWSLAVATKRDLSLTLRRFFHAELIHESIDSLWEREPTLSARSVLIPKQRATALWLLAGLCVAIALWPTDVLTALYAIASLFLAGIVGFKAFLCLVGAAHEEFEQAVTDEEAMAIPDAELPTFTILVPLYKEPEVLPILVAALRRLAYPISKLDIKLVLEEDDTSTIEAARALKLEGVFEFVLVPPSQPRTKPKACNYALQLARGEYCVIFDAEDKPEPLQLRRVVVAFRRGDPRLVCVQARLNYFNASENTLTRLFALDYALWFDFCLPALDHIGMPIPLGGTSNHFRTQTLRDLGAWDPFNVTEDADLGIRISQKGLRVGVVNSTTWEEACSRVKPWIKQRSRWMKGYAQTWLVHMRNPVELMRSCGLSGFLGFQIFVGGTVLASLLNPILLVLFVIWLATGWHPVPGAGEGPVLALGLACLILGNAFFVFMGVLAPLKRRELRPLALWGVLTPGYWLLASIACWRGVLQLVTEPHKWEKTPHGISAATLAEVKAATG